jgi:hypothetical protein
MRFAPEKGASPFAAARLDCCAQARGGAPWRSPACWRTLLCEIQLTEAEAGSNRSFIQGLRIPAWFDTQPSKMLRPLILVGASLPLAAAFVGTGPALRPASAARSAQSGLCALQATVETRREVLGKAAAVGAALAFGAMPAFAKGKKAVSTVSISPTYNLSPVRCQIPATSPLGAQIPGILQFNAPLQRHVTRAFLGSIWSSQ